MTNATYNPNEVYRYIVKYKRDHSGNSPTMREIQKAVGISSVSVVSYILDILESRGWLVREGHRGITLTGERWEIEPPIDVPHWLVE